jgi:hypothetical protein
VALAAERAKDPGRRAADGGAFGRLVSDEESASGLRPTRDRPLGCSAKADLECGALVAHIPCAGMRFGLQILRGACRRVVPTGPGGPPGPFLADTPLSLIFVTKSLHMYRVSFLSAQSVRKSRTSSVGCHDQEGGGLQLSGRCAGAVIRSPLIADLPGKYQASQPLTGIVRGFVGPVEKSTLAVRLRRSCRWPLESPGPSRAAPTWSLASAA